MKVVVLVPRREDHGRRDQLWAYVRSRYETEHPDWKIVEGHHKRGPFNRSAAINRAAKAVRAKWDVAVIADSDSFVGPAQVDAAVETAWRTGKMTLAYDRFHFLDRAMSDAIVGGFEGNWDSGISQTMEGTCSSVLAVRHDLWDESRGFDEGFTVWGGEDVAAWIVFDALAGGHERIPGDLWHLDHAKSPDSEEVSAQREAGWARLERYAECKADPEKVRALLDELHPDHVRV